MGWTRYHAQTDVRKTANRKKELDNQWTCESKETTWEVLKSSMVGTVYYSAIKRTDKETGTSKVFAMVCLTSIMTGDYWNFGYKDMTEDMHPHYYDCPESILKLLTPTEDDWSNEWRSNCKEQAKQKKALKTQMKGFKEGDKIKTKLWHEEERTLELSNYRGRLWWVDWSARMKYAKRQVFSYPYEVINEG